MRLSILATRHFVLVSIRAAAARGGIERKMLDLNFAPRRKVFGEILSLVAASRRKDRYRARTCVNAATMGLKIARLAGGRHSSVVCGDQQYPHQLTTRWP